jgi:tyrosine-protein kinase Etk/Wzc
MDETVHTREDIQAATGGAPILGMIPRIRQAGLNGKSSKSAISTIGGVGELGARLVAGRDPRNPVSEAYRSLRTNLTFSNPDKPPKIIVFTSPLPQDGKSTTAANLAITLTQQGIKTLLIDADLRRGLLHGVFGANRDPGLTNVLAGGAAISEAIQEIDLQESGKLDFMSSGPYPPNPAEILGSQRMKSLLQALDERYDLVLIDSAPLTVVTDAAVLGTKADGVVLVARANVTEKGALTYAAEQLRNVRAPILGCVLNDVDYRRDSRYYSTYGKYGYYHHYYYGDDGDKKKKKA